MIKVNNLSKSYGTTIVLKNVNLTINKGKIIVLYGKNGAGKTTLIKCIIKLLKFNKGKIDLGENSKVGVVLSNEMLIKKLSVFEYLKLVCLLKNIDKNTYNNKIDELINYIDLTSDKNKMIDTISNGAKSKLKLIASIIFEPTVLLLDEPFSGMDIIAIDKSIKLIKKKMRTVVLFLFQLIT